MVEGRGHNTGFFHRLALTEQATMWEVLKWMVHITRNQKLEIRWCISISLYIMKQDNEDHMLIVYILLV